MKTKQNCIVESEYFSLFQIFNLIKIQVYNFELLKK